MRYVFSQQETDLMIDTVRKTMGNYCQNGLELGNLLNKLEGYRSEIDWPDCKCGQVNKLAQA